MIFEKLLYGQIYEEYLEETMKMPHFSYLSSFCFEKNLIYLFTRCAYKYHYKMYILMQ